VETLEAAVEWMTTQLKTADPVEEHEVEKSTLKA
jgi:hypothetical protein